MPVDVGLDRDRSPGAANRLEHRRVELVAVVEDGDRVAGQQRAARRADHAVEEGVRVDRHPVIDGEGQAGVAQRDGLAERRHQAGAERPPPVIRGQGPRARDGPGQRPPQPAADARQGAADDAAPARAVRNLRLEPMPPLPRHQRLPEPSRLCVRPSRHPASQRARHAGQTSTPLLDEADADSASLPFSTPTGHALPHMIDTLHGWISAADAFVWGPPLLILLFGTHIFLTIRTAFMQRHLLTAIRLSVTAEKGAAGDVSPFAALTTALAATIGTGNIVGVATAVSLGGPGAVLWMWLTGVLGMATKYSEALLAVKYRVTTADGTMLGGPMYALERGLGMKWLGVLFALFTVFASFGIGNMVQANSISTLAASQFGVNVHVTGLDPGGDDGGRHPGRAEGDRARLRAAGAVHGRRLHRRLRASSSSPTATCCCRRSSSS